MSAPVQTSAPGPLNITQRSNAAFAITVTIRNPDGTLADLSACTAKWQVRPAPGDPMLTIDFGNTADTTLVLGGAGGTITATADETVITALVAADYAHDLLVIDESGNPWPWLAGKFTIQQGVSQ
jgi:hypothetical protein